MVASELYARRRSAVLDVLRARGDDAVAVFPAAPVYPRNNDVEHEYRQDSDFHYLTGFDEPSSVVCLSAKGGKTTMFVRPRDPTRETWDGPRAGIEGAKTLYGADEAFGIEDLDDGLQRLFENTSRVYYQLGRDRTFDDRLLRAVDRTRARSRVGISWPTEILDPGPIVHEMRLLKGASDLDAMRTAASITAEAHARAMKSAKPGMFEYEIEALLLETFRRRGSERPAYGSIVGSGPNATILHYRANDRRMQAGELLLIDAGCEYGYYASDVTRTFPVDGAFTREQRTIYELVLEAQIAGIEGSTVGATLDRIHATCVRVLTAGLVRLGLLSGEVDALIEGEAYKPFYMHRTSHWLGMDVHDVGAYFVRGAPRPLESGMVLTVEPGLYFGKDDERVVPDWRGIGVRIEDDILVTEKGPVNLTALIPKTVSDVERACRT